MLDGGLDHVKHIVGEVHPPDADPPPMSRGQEAYLRRLGREAVGHSRALSAKKLLNLGVHSRLLEVAKEEARQARPRTPM